MSDNKSLQNQINQLKTQLEDAKKKHKSEVDKLEKIIQGKNDEISKLEIKNTWDMVEDNSSMLRDQLQAAQKLTAAFQQDIQQKSIEIQNFRTEIIALKEEKKTFDEKIEQLNNDVKSANVKYETMKNQFELVQKQKEKLKENEEKSLKELENKKNEIEELKATIKKLEQNNTDLLKYVKEIQENEEEKRQKEIKLRLEKEEELKKKENDINKIKKENENKDMDQEAKDKFLTDILCEFLLKLNNSQYFISVFQLLENCLKHYDELKVFKKLDALYGCNLNHILYNFFGSFSSYISISNENISLSDFLSQKFFKYSEINKNDVELIKRISSIKISKDIKILDLYRKKKEVFFKSVNLTFDLLKNKIINDEDTKKMNLLNDKPDFLQTTKPPKDLTINFNEINIYKFGSLVDYQIYNIFPKLEKLKMITSDAYLPIFYSLILNCKNLSSFEIISTSDYSNSGNSSLDIFNDTLPIIFIYLRNLSDFYLENIFLSNKIIPEIISSIKNTSLKKLSLVNCFKSKEDFSLFNDYFFTPNNIEEINLSKHEYNIPTLLSTSLLNYSKSKNLVSIKFSECNLNKEDIQYIANYIVESPIIKYCNISKNNLTTLACSTFAYCLQKTKSLETLIMNECGINDESLVFLFNGKGSQTLKHINISDNNIGDIGLVSIGAFIKNSKQLEIFELKNCGGGDMGFSSIVNTIHLNDNNKIKAIYFEKNEISSISYEMLKKLNEIFKAKEVVFYLDKTEEDLKIDCVKFIK